MKFGFKIALFFVLNFALLLTVGKILFDNRPPLDGRLDYFLNALESTKAPYSFNLESLHKSHKYMRLDVVNSSSVIRSVCYEILQDRFKSTESCDYDFRIVLDEHAVRSIIAASYYPQNTLFSEFLFGHIHVYGMKLSDILAILR
jgi:hypothetical protein